MWRIWRATQPRKMAGTVFMPFPSTRAPPTRAAHANSTSARGKQDRINAWTGDGCARTLQAPKTQIALMRCLPAVVADLDGHGELFAIGVQHVFESQIVRSLAPEHGQQVLLAAGDDAAVGNDLERIAVEIGVV